jgi:hypothetical protein
LSRCTECSPLDSTQVDYQITHIQIKKLVIRSDGQDTAGRSGCHYCALQITNVKHYQQIIVSLTEAGRLMRKIDKVIINKFPIGIKL